MFSFSWDRLPDNPTLVICIPGKQKGTHAREPEVESWYIIKHAFYTHCNSSHTLHSDASARDRLHTKTSTSAQPENCQMTYFSNLSLQLNIVNINPCLSHCCNSNSNKNAFYAQDALYLYSILNFTYHTV